jgi:hypothetical protein
MSNKLNGFLNGVASGLLNPRGITSDYKHATRLFVDDTFRLSPRTKFLFYARFEIDKIALKTPVFREKHVDEIGYLLKSTDLPKYNFNTITKNQYNRKRVLYTNINYEPLNLTFHDDSAGIMNAMWAAYFGYYIKDRMNAPKAFDGPLYKTKDDPTLGFRFGLDSDQSVPFFKSITLYTMSRRRFLGYTLVRPRIKSWTHGGMDNSEPAFNENQMNVEYETVFYTGGSVSFDSPKGFAKLHYDTVPSSLSIGGGGVASLLGEGGVVDGLEEIFGNIQQGTAFSNPANAINTIASVINTANNLSNLSAAGIAQEGLSLLGGAGAGQIGSTIAGGINAAFPGSSGAGGGTTATSKTFNL